MQRPKIDASVGFCLPVGTCSDSIVGFAGVREVHNLLFDCRVCRSPRAPLR